MTPHEHMQVCLDEFRGTSAFTQLKGTKPELDIDRIRLDRFGCSRYGRYYGAGANLYRVYWHGGERDFRAPSKPILRKALLKLLEET